MNDRMELIITILAVITLVSGSAFTLLFLEKEPFISLIAGVITLVSGGIVFVQLDLNER